ncbi:zinc finger protein 782 isoform X1 [Anguilla rostrata]|uniref:zinc finger protein 782 isoform X1 n=2 Tax=Anguilla rostrata TaxID=7938 RepID=UPI0030CE5288
MSRQHLKAETLQRGSRDGAQTLANMSDAILTFQVQLSAVMETVLKSAMYEITRLVEDSFLEEVARSKQEVEALRQRLQWSESRHRERESGGRARCLDCGRVGVSSEESEDPPSGTLSGVEEGRGLKQEKALEGSWSSCSVGGSNPGPLSALEEEATPSPVRELDTSSTAPSDLDRDRPDSLLKEEVEELRDITGGDDIQGTWLPCAEGEGLLGAEADPPPPLSKGCAEPEWSPAVGQDTAPSSGSLLPERQSSRPHGGDACGAYESEAGQEAAARRLGLAGPQRCGPRRSDPDSQRVTWTTFKLGDSHAEAEGRGLCERVLQAGADFPQEKSQSDALANHALQPANDGPPTARPLSAQPPSAFSDAAPVKQEVEAQPGWGERAGGGIYPQPRRQGAESRAQTGGDPPTLQNRVRHHEQFPQTVTSQPKPQGCGPSGRHTQTRVTDRTAAVTHSSAAADRGVCSSYSKAFVASKNAQTHARAFAGERRLGPVHFGKSGSPLIGVRSHLRPNMERTVHSCTQCGKTFSHFSHLKAHQQTHTGERPFCCTLCGRSFTKLSNLKAHRRVHTGERPYNCTDCGKRFTQKCNLKRHQRIHTAERLFSCK